MMENHSLLNYMNDMAVNMMEWTLKMKLKDKFRINIDTMLIKSDVSNNNTYKGVPKENLSIIAFDHKNALMIN